MAKITPPQDIPSALEKGYSAALSTAIMEDGLPRVKSRAPFRIESLQGCRTIRPPIPRGLQVSNAMCAQRQIFANCVKCFNIQPITGGVTPPTIGPRNRSWWYNAAAEWNWWYFTYFMKMTLDAWSIELATDWCKKWPPGDSLTSKLEPETNFGKNAALSVMSEAVGDLIYSYIKRPTGGLKTLHLKIWLMDDYGEDYYVVHAHEVTEPWTENLITWNTQPPLGKILKTIVIPRDSEQKWITFKVEGDHDIALTMYSIYGYIAFYSKENLSFRSLYWSA